MAEQQLNLYATYRYTDRYFDLPANERKAVRAKIATFATSAMEAGYIYSVFPARCDCDFLLWSAQSAEEPEVAAEVLTQYPQMLEDLRKYVTPNDVLWGFTRPSMYARGKTEQDIDPFDGDRSRYFVIYPFAKTKEW
ncbi:MAG: chlorite dismutase family protein, partial [Armatimonadetes bacterium]|nr:chlorite dismutase family protein [Armatimonadota bacterium]